MTGSLIQISKSFFVTCLVLAAATSAQAGSAQCSDLNGKVYLGIDGQGGQPQPGCEGCGNEGAIDFESETTLNITWPGGDTIESCSYALNGPALSLDCEFAGKRLMTVANDCKEIMYETTSFRRSQKSK